MSTLQITPIIAPQSLACFRCLTIGIAEETISQGDECMEITHGGKISFACMDCYARMYFEIEFGTSGSDPVSEPLA